MCKIKKVDFKCKIEWILCTSWCNCSNKEFKKALESTHNNAKGVGNHVLDKVDTNMNKNTNILLLLLLLLFCKKENACKRNIPGLISNP